MTYSSSVKLKVLFFIIVALCDGVHSQNPLNPNNEKDPSTLASRLGKSVGSADCNCTSFFNCEISENPSPEDDEDGANLEIINIRNGFPKSGSSKNPTSSGDSSTCSHYLEICCNLYQQSGMPKRNVTVTNPKCGKRNAHGVGFRIVSEEGEAQMGEFPWMIAVTELSKDLQGSVYLCGGSLIHPRVVLLAAHCVENKLPDTLIIRAGEWDTQTDNEDPYGHYDRQISEVIIHEDYTKKTVLKNDIALLILNKEVPMTRHIGPICLSSDLKPTEGQRCFASGWGRNLYGKEGSYQVILKKVELPIVSQTTCESRLRETRLGPRFKLHNSFVCAGGERGKDTCKGDGGSPLVCEIPGSNVYAQYGIVSWGLSCGDPIPGVYVNVPLFVPWIEEKMREMGLDSSYFQG